MRARKISTKSSSSLWKTPRKSDQPSPKIGALNETDWPSRRPARRFLELPSHKLSRTDDRSGHWQFIFLSTGWHKTPFYCVCPACRSCSTPAGSSPSSIKRNNAQKDGRTVVTSAVAFWESQPLPKHGNSFLRGTVIGVTHPEAPCR